MPGSARGAPTPTRRPVPTRHPWPRPAARAPSRPPRGRAVRPRGAGAAPPAEPTRTEVSRVRWTVRARSTTARGFIAAGVSPQATKLIALSSGARRRRRSRAAYAPLNLAARPPSTYLKVHTRHGIRQNQNSSCSPRASSCGKRSKNRSASLFYENHKTQKNMKTCPIFTETADLNLDSS